MGTKAAREAVATVVRAAVPDGWVTYPAPPDTLSSPAVVIGPRDPYVQFLTYKQAELLLRLSLLVPRNLGTAAMDVMDDAIDAVRAALLNASDVLIAKVGEHAVVSEGNTDHIAAIIDIAVSYDPSS